METETRTLDWELAGWLLDELGADRADLREAVLDQLPDAPAGDETPFPVTLPTATWARIDALCYDATDCFKLSEIEADLAAHPVIEERAR